MNCPYSKFWGQFISIAFISGFSTAQYHTPTMRTVDGGRSISMTTERGDGLIWILQDNEQAIASARMIFSIIILLPT